MLKGQKNKYPDLCLHQYFPVNDYGFYENIIKEAAASGINKIRIELKPDEWQDFTLRKWNESLIADLSRHFEILLSVKVQEKFNNLNVLLEQIFSLFETSIQEVELNTSGKSIDLQQLKKILKSIRSFRKKLIIQRELADDSKLIPSDVISINYKGTENISAKVKKLKKEYGLPVWITGLTVHSDKSDELLQLNILANIAASDAERVYWNNLLDYPNKDSQGEIQQTGLLNKKGVPKLAVRLFQRGGFENIKNYSDVLRQNILKKISSNGNHKNIDIIRSANKTAAVFGGAGFIGTNVAEKYLAEGYKVRIFDNLARPGVEENLKWLIKKYGNKVEADIADIRKMSNVASAVKDVNIVFNFAAQVAVTTSLVDPVHDFEVNIKGAINLLESLRALHVPVPLLFTSTNKVYGGFEDLLLTSDTTRYEPVEEKIKLNGIDERRALDFHSPYGCSKGSADQYVLDYCRSYRMPTIVLRLSCIYGPHQFGTEDQGWVAHFLIQTIKNNPVILYGDGKQVRDILFVEDLVRAFRAAEKNITNLAGNAFNIGGGVKNTVSLVELLSYIGELTGIKNNVKFSDWRTGDQKYYVSDISKFSNATGWEPEVNVKNGVDRLYGWLLNNYPFEKKVLKPETKINEVQENKVLAS